MGKFRFQIARAAALAVLAGVAVVWSAHAAHAQACVGDCNSDGSVVINELILGVNIAQGNNDVTACPSFDCQHNGTVPINCLIQGVNHALNDDCSPTTSCPLDPGFYTLTQVSGGELTVSSLTPFPFPEGGTLKGDIRQPNADCVHDVIVPFPGGFSSPVFCIPALGFSVSVVQTACGVGKLDSDGGSDFTVTNVGDTSDASDVCDLPHANCARGSDSDVRVDVTVGDGAADTCTSGSANAIIAVPVHTTTWIEHSSGSHCGNDLLCAGGAQVDQPCENDGDCPGSTCEPADGTFDPGPDPIHDDMLVVDFPQILDFTTDTSATTWADIDGDGCTIAGNGPPGGFTGTGTCLDLTTKRVTTVATGPIGSAGVPLFDLTYRTMLPNILSGPEPLTNATCDSPPAINFEGLAHQCITGGGQ